MLQFSNFGFGGLELEALSIRVSGTGIAGTGWRAGGWWIRPYTPEHGTPDEWYLHGCSCAGVPTAQH